MEAPRNKYAIELLKSGVVVVKLFEDDEIENVRGRFINELAGFPEYINPTVDTVYVYGTLGALGNPASFHNPTVRMIRKRAHFVARRIFRHVEAEAFRNSGCLDAINQTNRLKMRNIEQLFDRMCIRRKGTKTSAESWHRDIYSNPNGRDNKKNEVGSDSIFGGWVNLDLETSHYFSCVKGTHLDAFDGSGFVKINPEDAKKYKDSKSLIEIPPGHWVIFYQQIVHEVLSRKMAYDSYRQFLGFRLTRSDQSLIDHTNTITSQGVPQKLPGGMAIKMYANLNIAYQLDHLKKWSVETFKPECLIQRNGKDDETYSIVGQKMRSLEEYEFELYPDYAGKEMRLMQPISLVKRLPAGGVDNDANLSINVVGVHQFINLVDQQYVKIVNGDLLKATETYVAHQCNCVSNNAKTLAEKIFDKFPYADSYSLRTKEKSTYSTPGTMEIFGDDEKCRYVCNMYAQFYPCGPDKYANDNLEKRLEWFKKCLEEMARHLNGIENKSKKSIAMPFNIGCGAGGGNWSLYLDAITKFATTNQINVTLYKI